MPSYVILLHTWGKDDEESTFNDLVEGTGKSRLATEKFNLAESKLFAIASNLINLD
jgi:hypothetical protein